jgi:hypothetical protein
MALSAITYGIYAHDKHQAVSAGFRANGPAIYQPSPTGWVCRSKMILRAVGPLDEPKEENRTADGRRLTQIIKEFHRLSVSPSG